MAFRRCKLDIGAYLVGNDARSTMINDILFASVFIDDTVRDEIGIKRLARACVRWAEGLCTVQES